MFVAFQRRFDPSFSSLVQTVRDGGIGQLQFVRSVSRDNPVPSIEYIRTSGGIFHDCMVHDLDMVYHIVGEVPTHLSSFGSSFLPGVAEAGDFDNVVASLVFPSGITASIDINRKSVYGYDQRIEAFGDGGMLQADNYHNTSLTQAGAGGFKTTSGRLFVSDSLSRSLSERTQVLRALRTNANKKFRSRTTRSASIICWQAAWRSRRKSSEWLNSRT